MSQQERLQAKAKELLIEKRADVVIGYGLTANGTAGAVFVTDVEQTDKLLWNTECTANLAGYLKFQENKKFSKPAVIVKPCDARAFVVLEMEKQIERDKMTVIGVECYGTQKTGEEQQDKCRFCTEHTPSHCDIVIEAESKPEKPAVPNGSQYEKLEKLLALSPAERFEYWKNEFSRCIKCYACRQNCPMCYCSVCVADKNRPVRIDTSATLKGNFAWNILRAFHLAGRCIGCAACSASCPAGIDLDLLNMTLAKAAKEQFDYTAGTDRNAEPLIGTFSPEDQEHFIR